MTGVGLGDRLRPPVADDPESVGNRVSYRRGGVTEWYRNGPLGLEQGFTVDRRPGSGAEWLTIAVRISGGLMARRSGTQVVFRARSGGSSVLRYGELSASDAAGRSLPARIVLRARTLLIRVDAMHARFPVRVDPMIEQAKLTASDEAGDGYFGAQVALSGDGNTALVGGAGDNMNAGAAWVFTRSGSTWTQQGPKLTPNDAQPDDGNDLFGSSVALSGDGSTALIGGTADNNGAGAAWVFTRSGSTWAQQGSKLTANDETGAAEFGQSVSLSSDGNTALVGGNYDNGWSGAAWVFTRSGSTWAQQGSKLTGDQGGQGEFGSSVALSGDGNTALISEAADDNYQGAAFVFGRSGSTWTQQGPKLTVPAQDGQLGHGVALSYSGGTGLVGAGGNQPGGAFAFTRSGSSWSQQGPELLASDESGDGDFGRSVSLSANGALAVIGGPADGSGSPFHVGAAWVFALSGGTWQQVGAKTNASGEVGDGDFGSSVALSADGSTALVAGPADNNLVGAAWAYSVPAVVFLSSPSDGSYTNQREPTFNGTAGTQPGDSGKVTVNIYSGSSASGAPLQTLTATVQPDGSYPVQATSALADGRYTAQAEQSDAAGNVGFSSANTFTVDTVPPTVTLSAPANGADTNDARPTFMGSAGTQTPPDSGSVTINVYSGSSATGTPLQTLTAAVQDGAYSVQASAALADGSYTAQAQQSDSAGNVGFSSANTFTVDTVPPTVTLTSPANGTDSNQTQPTFSGVAGTQPGDSGSVAVEVYRGSSASGTPVQTLSAQAQSDGSYSVSATSPLPDGTYTAQTEQSDSAGNVGYSSANTFTVDTVPPSVTLTVPANGSSTNQNEATFGGVAGTQPGDLSSVTVALYSGSSASGSPIQTLTAQTGSDGSYSVSATSTLPDGQYTAQAKQSDSAANVGLSSANTFTVDTVPPTITLTSPANGSSTNQSQPTFSGVAGTQPGDLGSLTVEVYGGPSASGTPVQTLTAQPQSDGSYSVSATSPLADGTYTAQAQQADAAGNIGKSTANTFTIDTPPPAVALSAPPSGADINQSQPTFSGTAATQPSDSAWVTVKVYPGSSASGAVAETLTTQVQPDGSYSAQASSALADGTFTAQAQQADDAGNVGYSEPTTFTIDTHVPAVTVSIPANGSTDRYRSPSFSGAVGTAPDDQPQVAITVYPGTSATGSPVETLSATASGGQWSAQSAALSNGTYTIAAQQTDLAGTTGTATSTFTLDATPPNTSISSGPANPSESSGASFTFFSSEEGSTFQCQLDGGSWAACSSPATYSGLADGAHTFTVRATDTWGNTDPTGATATWTVDTSAPHTVISSGPPNPTQSSTATFVFFSIRPDSTFQCQLDSSSWTACSSPATYSGVSAGQHTFSVRATDQAGVTDPTPATASWTVGSVLLSTSSIEVISGTPSGERLVKPSIDLKTGIASIGTAYCSTHAKHGCALTLQVNVPAPPGITADAASAGRPLALSLGSVRVTLIAGHHATLRLRLGTKARAALRRHTQIRARATFMLRGGRHVAHMIVLRVVRGA